MKLSSPPTDARDRIRVVWVAAFLSLLFCLLVLRFYQIQIIEGEKWTKVALSQHRSVASIPFMRGSFFSNTSVKEGHPEEEQPFVIDVPKFHLYIDPGAIPREKKERMAASLIELLEMKEKKEKIFLEFHKKSRSRKLIPWLDREMRRKIEAWWADFSKKEKLAKNALYFLTDYQRSYPFGSLLGAVLHTVQEQKDPKTEQALPTGGLEMLLNPYLQGKLGKKEFIRSPSHPIGTGTVIEEPVHGADIYLTVNHYLQAIVEDELAKGVRRANAKGGWAVMMDPYTGEILAIGQTPSFNPESYRDFFNDPTLQEHTRVKAVNDAFEPGSIFKPILLAVALKANEELYKMGKGPLFTPEEKIATSTGWFPGRSKPIKDGRRHKYLNMYLAIQKSSNVYMAKVAERLIEALGDQWLRSAFFELFGFGKKTHIELPGETPGLLPTPGKLHPNGKLEWSLATPFSLAMGHNILVNSVQIVKAYAILANGGYQVQPHLVRRIVKRRADGSKETLIDHTQLKPMRQILSRQITEPIIQAMKYSTKLGGTSTRADISGYTEAGKSGTSEKIINGVYAKEHNISSFIGIVPASRPRFVLMVSLDDPEVKFIPGVGKNQHGGVSAAPIFKEIATRALEYLGVAPDDPYGYPYGDPRRNREKADWAEEVRALKKLYEQWNGP